MSGKKFYSDTIKKKILINTTRDRIWKKISDVNWMAEQIDEIRTVKSIPKRNRGVGAIRKFTFYDGNEIEEHVVAWNPKDSFSYVATTGLPLRMYHATLSIQPKNKKTAYLVWSTYLNSKKMTARQFKEFIVGLETFYENSLKKIKLTLEN